MLAAAIFGSVFAGVVLLQANYRAMGRRAAANKTLVFGMLASAALIALSVRRCPRACPGTPISIATALTFYKLADVMQGPAFFKHRAAGGRPPFELVGVRHQRRRVDRAARRGARDLAGVRRAATSVAAGRRSAPLNQAATPSDAASARCSL